MTPQPKAETAQQAMFDTGEPKAKTTQLGGYVFGDVVSAMQKEIRRGDERAAVYWAMILANEAAVYCWKRLLVIAAEDIGLAAPDVVAQVNALAVGWRFAKDGSWYVSEHSITMAVMLLCRAPKSTEVEDLQSLTKLQLKSVFGKMADPKTGADPAKGAAHPEWKRPILREHRDAHTAAGKAAGATWQNWYSDRHQLFGIPVNQYTRELWALEPSWNPEIEGLPTGRPEDGAA